MNIKFNPQNPQKYLDYKYGKNKTRDDNDYHNYYLLIIHQLLDNIENGRIKLLKQEILTK